MTGNPKGSEEPDDLAQYGLLMPFVVCASQGGPYDDPAFVAGFRMAELAQRMKDESDDVIESTEPPGLLPQIDLFAMQSGWAMTSEPWEEHPEEWAYVTLRREAAHRDR